MKEFTETERHFIGLLHDTINRMANNIANCKNWFMAVVAAVIALVANNPESADLLWVLVFINLLFYGLDSYYLQLEKNFRALEEDFVQKIFREEDDIDLNEWLYNFNFMKLNNGNVNKDNWYKALKSKSTWLFYLPMLLLIIVMYFMISDINPFVCIANWICSSCCNCCK